LGKALKEVPLPLSGETGSYRWQFGSKTTKVTLQFPDQGNLANKQAKLQTNNITFPTQELDYLKSNSSCAQNARRAIAFLNQ